MTTTDHRQSGHEAIVEDLILLCFLHQLIDGVFFSRNLSGFLDTPVRTDTAGGALVPVKDQLSIHYAVGLLRTFHNALSADHTLIMVENEFFLIPLTLRVMTPAALQGTSLEENRGAHAVSVMG